MKKILLLMLFIICLIFLAGCSTNSIGRHETVKEINLKETELHPEEYPTAQAEIYLSKLLEEKSGGRIKLKVYPGGQLGQGKPIQDAINAGIIDMDRAGVEAYTKEIPMTEAFIMPFLFRDESHLWKVLDGPIGERLTQEFEKHDIIILGYYAAGARSFYTRKPVTTVDDIKGMKIRIIPTDLFKNMMQALGATGVEILFNDIYPKIQTGDVDGAENNLPSYLTGKHYELAPYLVLDEHLFIPEFLYVSKRTWDSLSPEDQKLLKECGAEAAKLQRKLWSEFEAKATQELESKGVKIIRPDKEPFRKAMEPLYEKYPQHKDLIKEIQSVN
jgi:tripartite ATP-independent transporter DctP family solute receptor